MGLCLAPVSQHMLRSQVVYTEWLDSLHILLCLLQWEAYKQGKCEHRAWNSTGIVLRGGTRGVKGEQAVTFWPLGCRLGENHIVAKDHNLVAPKHVYVSIATVAKTSTCGWFTLKRFEGMRLRMFCMGGAFTCMG